MAAIAPSQKQEERSTMTRPERFLTRMILFLRRGLKFPAKVP